MTILDYRKPENRTEYFSALYHLNLKFKVHPGLVYLYVPELRKRLGWSEEDTLWFTVINGHTQNPITSMRIIEQLPGLPTRDSQWSKFEDWFNEDWVNLSYDTDRRKQKKDTLAGLRSYANLVGSGTQKSLYESKSYEDCWSVANSIHSFGRLSTFSYLEYVRIAGVGPDCTKLMFNDFDGSRSHRNGMFFLLGMDESIYDKRLPNGHSGKYDQFGQLCEGLEKEADSFLLKFSEEYPSRDVGKFTLESCLCQFKNGFFGRRYPGVYADMGWDRIKWYEDRGFTAETRIFRKIREDCLPEWLREECEDPIIARKKKATRFVEEGVPHRFEFLDLGSFTGC
jgi:hypothetical protein